MNGKSWNHNLQYHAYALSKVPEDCGKALDVGCGQGALTRKLARVAREVIGIDTDVECLQRARAANGRKANVTFLEGDVLTEPLGPETFDFVVSVASLHHLPLDRALRRFQELLRPGGVLVVVGLYKSVQPIDYLYAAVAMPISWTVRQFVKEEEVGAPVEEPRETLKEIRRQSAAVLSGSVLRRRLFFRYTLVWKSTAD